MRTFFELFGRSPFEPLARHAERVHEVVRLVRPVVEAFVAQEWEKVEELSERISRMEHTADEAKQEIRIHLPRSLFLPVDRGDLLSFLKEQDRIADCVEDLAVLLALRQTPTPEGMRQPFLALVDQVLKTTDSWYEMASGLPKLQESSFTGPEMKKTVDLVRELGEQEFEADQVQDAVSRALVRHEEELGPVSFFFWMRIIHKLGEMANHAENTGDRLRLMLAKS